MHSAPCQLLLVWFMKSVANSPAETQQQRKNKRKPTIKDCGNKTIRAENSIRFVTWRRVLANPFSASHFVYATFHSSFVDNIIVILHLTLQKRQEQSIGECIQISFMCMFFPFLISSERAQLLLLHRHYFSRLFQRNAYVDRRETRRSTYRILECRIISRLIWFITSSATFESVASLDTPYLLRRYVSLRAKDQNSLETIQYKSDTHNNIYWEILMLIHD